MLYKGFTFGMILQLAIGPICMFVLNTALQQGFFAAELAVLGTVVTDGTEILLAILGVGLVLEKSIKAKKIMKLFGVCVLVVYGISSILSVVDFSILPTISIPFVSENPFIQAILLALSNPLTIVFWASIFSTKIIEENMQKNDLHFFAFGCLMSTLFFLSVVAFVGSFFATTIPPMCIKLANGFVGVFMLVFAYKNAKIDVEKSS